MADLTPISSWSAADVLHFARRAGFGITPERAAELAALPPGTTIDGWIDGTVAANVAAAGDATLFNAVLGSRADVATEGVVDANTSDAGAVAVAKVPAPHAFLVSGSDAWRNSFAAGQAYWAFRMQYNPSSFPERLALFWHNLFATGWNKVDNMALMLNQVNLFRTQGLGGFADLLVAVSKDPAMCLWLDSVSNNASNTNIPNENYAREVMELYSLGVDNGYNQTDITQLARALSGWSFTIPPAAKVINPTSPSQWKASTATFTVYQGQPIAGNYLWWGGSSGNGNVYYMHPDGTHTGETTSITYLGNAFDITTKAGGLAPGENALRSILTSRAANCADFLAKRLLLHFVSSTYAPVDASDLSAVLQGNGFDLGATLKTLLKSKFFFDLANRYTLVEGPVGWTVRAARMLGMSLAAGDAQSPKGFPAWRVITSPYFDQLGMKLLDPSGPNGWHEDTAWLNSNTMRYRTRMAAALALGESYTSYYNNGGGSYVGEALTLFPSNVDAWFPVVPTSGLDVYNRLEGLLQPGPIPTTVRDSWIAALWPTFAWSSAADKNKARELAFLILCSPAGQLY
ncbi:MAG TPA: DUF1800 family protein [Holophagaceae bacterium]|nr:DUF1800 family protein [Holophagaceae bacterium]